MKFDGFLLKEHIDVLEDYILEFLYQSGYMED